MYILHTNFNITIVYAKVVLNFQRLNDTKLAKIIPMLDHSRKQHFISKQYVVPVVSEGIPTMLHKPTTNLQV